MSLATDERRKYTQAWKHPQYGAYSPGESMIPLFRQMVRIPRGTVIDLGAGGGRASRQLRDLGWRVTQMDLVAVPGRGRFPFIRGTLWAPWRTGKGKTWDLGYCCDVMEHIPPEKVDAVLEKIFARCGRVFFSINFQKDHFGGVIGHPLHLTIRPFKWWADKLGEHGRVIQARDLLGEGAFYVAR